MGGLRLFQVTCKFDAQLAARHRFCSRSVANLLALFTANSETYGVLASNRSFRCIGWSSVYFHFFVFGKNGASRFSSWRHILL